MTHQVSTPPPLRVVVAEADPMARRVIVSELRANRMDVVAEAVDGPEAVELAREHNPRILLTESALPRLDGIAVTRRLSSDAAGVRVVFLSAATDDDLQMRALRAGAHGFLSKHEDLGGLARTLLAVDRGEAAISRHVTMVLIGVLRGSDLDASGMRPVKSVLTKREWEVMELLATGASTTDVADALFLTPDTIYTHVKSTMRKLGVHDRAAALAEVHQLKLGALAA
jgi:NarL family two-component system response regulator LiaR